MRGPKPKPTKLKLIGGNPGKRKVNKSEAQPAVKIPKCPGHLNERAKKEWKIKAAELVRLGLVTELDDAILAAYCQARARWEDASEKVDELGQIMKTPKGNLIQNPYLAVANRAMEQMTRLAAELGMSSSSRARIPVPDNPADPLSKFLNRGKTT